MRPLSLAFALVAATPAFAQGLSTEKALPLDLALVIAQGSIEKCRADGYQVSVTVVDQDGLVKARLRDDATGPHTVGTSGAPGGENDEACSNTALQKAADRPK